MRDLHDFSLGKEISFLENKDVLQYYYNLLRPVPLRAKVPPTGTDFLEKWMEQIGKEGSLDHRIWEP